MERNKLQAPKWAQIHFSEDERETIRTTWRKLVDGDRLNFGEGSSAKSIMDKLVNQLKSENSEFKRGHRSGFPAGSKKYKWILKFVTRESKRENGQDQEEDAEQLEVKSSAMSFRSV